LPVLTLPDLRICKRVLRAALAPANFPWQVLEEEVVDAADTSGDSLLRVLTTLANPHRLRVVAALAQQRNYVSQLARELGISRALLQVHLRKLQAAGLVTAAIEVSEDGKAMKFYEVTSFAVELTPKAIMAAAATLTAGGEPGEEAGDE
jgi:DNA-binding transcriptional ArsR family regulator